MFSILSLGKPESHVTWSKNTEKLVETSSEVTDSNMEMAAKEVLSISKNNGGIKSTGISIECICNSRGWQATKGVAAAIAGRLGK